MKKILLLLTVLVMTVACKKAEGERWAENLQRYADSIESGYEVKVLKLDSVRGWDWVVMKITHPTYGEQYFVVSMEHFNKKDSFEQWLEKVENGTYFIDTTITPYTNNHGQVVPGYYTDSQGNLYESTVATAKDLEKMGGMAQSFKVLKDAEFYAAQYGLSESRSIEVAKMVSAFKQVSGSRSLTDADAESFSQELLGVSFGEVKSALTGTASNLDALIEKAAEKNDISPEHMSEIIGTIIAQ